MTKDKGMPQISPIILEKVWVFSTYDVGVTGGDGVVGMLLLQAGSPSTTPTKTIGNG